MMNFKKSNINILFITIILLLATVALNFIDILPNIFAENRVCNIYIINSENKKIDLDVEIADTEKSMKTGLMYRENLEKNSGMLFVFKNERMLNFWMKNTSIPLDIAYVDKSGRINEIYYMKPLDSSIYYRSRMKAMYALEVNKDWYKNNKITPGCWIDLNGCIRK